MKLSRVEYKTIKGYNKEELESFITTIYNNGMKDGAKAVSKKMVNVVSEGLKNTPGIGEKRYNQIMDSINAEAQKG